MMVILYIYRAAVSERRWKIFGDHLTHCSRILGLEENGD